MTLTRALARPATTAVTLACLAGLTLAGCSGTPEKVAETPTSGTTGTAGATTAADPSASTTSASPTESTTSADPGPTDDSTIDEPDGAGGPAARLLAADDVPGFNEDYRWTSGRTSTREPRTPFGTCQRFAMTSIGASKVAVRTYRPPSAAAATDHAGELIADFADSTTARRAFAVLKSWRAKCADRLRKHARSEVGALEDVPVDGGSAGWYLLTYGPLPDDPDSQFFDAQGMAVVGSRIAMVEMILGGQDYNYEPGHEPMVAALQRAAAALD